MSLAGKVAIITGGTKGIGAATAKLFVVNGAKVAVNYSSDKSAADALVNQLGPHMALAYQGDAGNVDSIEAFIKATVEKFGKLDIVIANAGILPMKTVEATTSEDFDRTYNINVKGPYFLAQKAIPHMSSGGSITFVSTSQCHASTVTPPYTLYISTKGAIEQLTRGLAKDLGPKGIRVNAIAPGPTGTDLFLRGKSDEMIKGISSLSPLNRLGKPEELAEAFLWVSSDKAAWVSGQIVKVNGGMV